MTNVSVMPATTNSMGSPNDAIQSGNASSIYKCTPRQITRHVERVLLAGRVPFVRSSPGMGKSSIARQIAKRWNLYLIDWRASSAAPEDLTGLPRFNDDGTASFHPFADLFPIEGTPIPEGYDGWLLFADEFNSAPKSVEAAAYKLFLDRMVGQKKLHERCLLMAAGNLETDKAIVNPQSTAMKSRMIHFEMIIDHQEWLEDVAFAENYDPRIIAYLSYKPSELMNFDPDSEERTFNCPRTWEFVNDLLGVIDGPLRDDDAPLFAGTISAGSAVNFLQFSRVFESMITVDEIVADPKGVRVPTEQSVRYAVTCHMMDKVTKDNFDALATYIDRFDMTFKILFFRSVIARQPQLRAEPAFTRAMVGLSKYLND